jgi:hypothetical protein
MLGKSPNKPDFRAKIESDTIFLMDCWVSEFYQDSGRKGRKEVNNGGVADEVKSSATSSIIIFF